MQTDNCLICPALWKLRRTKKGHKECIYCWYAYTELMQLDDADTIMELFCEEAERGIRNCLQFWTSKEYRCPKCRLNMFRIDVESYDRPKEGIFLASPAKRTVIRCANCNAKIYQEDVVK